MSHLVTLNEHRAFFVVIAFAAVFFLSDIWIYREFVRAESYFALGARLMVESNEWLAPHAPDELLLNKPPLSYWLIGVSYKLFGVNYGTSRLISVLAAIGVLAIVYALGVWFDGIRTGLTSAAMLASGYIFLSFARMAMSDMLLTLWVTAALACFIVALAERTERTDRARRHNEKLLAVVHSDPKAVAVLFEREYLQLAEKNPDWRILAAAETFGRGGLNWKKVNDPKRERMLLIAHAH